MKQWCDQVAQSQNRSFLLAERYSDMNIFFLFFFHCCDMKKMFDKTYNFEAICSLLKKYLEFKKTTTVIMKIHDRDRERLNMSR